MVLDPDIMVKVGPGYCAPCHFPLPLLPSPLPFLLASRKDESSRFLPCTSSRTDARSVNKGDPLVFPHSTLTLTSKRRRQQQQQQQKTSTKILEGFI